MKQNESPTLLRLLCILLIALPLMTQFVAPVEAKGSHGEKAPKSHMPPKHRDHHNADHVATTGPAMAPPDEPSIFDVLSYGAKGDGKSDDSKVLVAAWQAARKVPSSTLRNSPELKFLIKPAVTLQGPCASGHVLQIDGTSLSTSKNWLVANVDLVPVAELQVGRKLHHPRCRHRRWSGLQMVESLRSSALHSVSGASGPPPVEPPMSPDPAPPRSSTVAPLPPELKAPAPAASAGGKTQAEAPKNVGNPFPY